jgi:hypothetical protein
MTCSRVGMKPAMSNVCTEWYDLGWCNFGTRTSRPPHGTRTRRRRFLNENNGTSASLCPTKNNYFHFHPYLVRRLSRDDPMTRNLLSQIIKGACRLKKNTDTVDSVIIIHHALQA